MDTTVRAMIKVTPTEDGYVSIVAQVGMIVLSFDLSKENALKVAGRIMEAADELDKQNEREVLQ